MFSFSTALWEIWVLITWFQPGSRFVSSLATIFPRKNSTFLLFTSYEWETSWSSPNSACSIDSEAFDYIPDYDIKTKGNCESSDGLRDDWTALNEWILLGSLQSCQTSQDQRKIPLAWGECVITFPISWAYTVMVKFLVNGYPDIKRISLVHAYRLQYVDRNTHR